jgi:hypothetical protein
MGYNKTQRQRNEENLRHMKVLEYKKEVERMTQDNTYYNNILKKENRPEEILNYKDLVNIRVHNEGYIQFLNSKIERISKL